MAMTPPVWLVKVWKPMPTEQYDKTMMKRNYAEREPAELCARYLGLWFDWFRGGPECMRMPQ